MHGIREFQEGFVTMWPTTFVQQRLAGADDANRDLLKHIRELDKATPELTTEYLDADFFQNNHPAVQWLKDSINQTVIEYLQHLGVDYAVNWVIQGWSNINRFGDYHDYHNHPRSYLSGNYYVRMPKSREKLNSRSDLRPGCITFYDPRYSTNMNGIAKDPYIDPEYTLLPEPGMLLMWPGFINHFVHPNLSKEQRVSVSFNIVLRWSDSYLPDQN